MIPVGHSYNEVRIWTPVEENNQELIQELRSRRSSS